MAKIEMQYKGSLQTLLIHGDSKEKIATDAPKDNNGLGRCFSPTDMLAGAYLSCMMTIIGIYCDKNNLTLANASGMVEKIMGSAPRRIIGLNIAMDLTGNDWSIAEQTAIKNAAVNCPVAKSVSKDMVVNVQFNF
jgi:putative redox protein